LLSVQSPDDAIIAIIAVLVPVAWRSIVIHPVTKRIERWGLWQTRHGDGGE
jgi:hypothetical protein